ncbi:hypothetical protein H4R33_001230 [Dimargaris cristalligena]|uniref:SnoaL-like domain-containing protein n=1 Tax=Dimargaris cristalligena TaxID=215637 RepID=A0A4P9ZYT3_9FUNG|nr:hypothetical protein H4R33_001230 [Dimargaris cristalligena]RKP38538.1 hypothetical protein BJ085DRAFT_35128 [Dimargaris cristalligena]|eukprot:RKP38538.1 hypothetical protein BJ085DRAFT_35128 [Dimargaris cristalligena]
MTDQSLQQRMVPSASSSAAPALSTARQQLLDDILQLYQCRPTHNLFRHYDNQAIFEDPISYLPGIGSIKAAFYAMPKLFRSSTTRRQTVIHNEPTELRVKMVQDYTFRGLGVRSTMPSTLVLQFKTTENGTPTDKVILHRELWWGTPLSYSSDGALGKVAEVGTF